MVINKKWLALFIVLGVVIAVFLIRNNQQGYNSTDNTISSEGNSNIQSQGSLTEEKIDSSINTTNSESITDNSGKISRETLMKHSSQKDCWVSYDGKVYDITSYLPKHPGTASKIVPYCGKADEFKVAFEKKHGKSKVQTLMSVGTFIGDFDVMGSLN